MNKYEIVAILDPQKVEGNGQAFIDQMVATMKELGANATRVKDFEQRVFTYAIKKRKAGHYWDIVVEAEGSFPAQLLDTYRLNATVLRLCIFDFVDGQDDDVFTPRPEHDTLIKEEIQDFDRDERPYRPREER
ncbi:MAG: 30S ribosomal protein S6 [Victivallales bacterium]|nr:30S ribosomal protein S6 [Victivallales bacterium]